MTIKEQMHLLSALKDIKTAPKLFETRYQDTFETIVPPYEIRATINHPKYENEEREYQLFIKNKDTNQVVYDKKETLYAAIVSSTIAIVYGNLTKSK